MLQNQPFDIASLHAAYADGLGVSAVVGEAYRRAEAASDPGIFLHLIDQEAAAAEADALGPFDPGTKPLWGIPFAIKDNIDAAGAPTTAACPAYAYTAHQDAFAVATLRAAGAILIGKTNLDQFATGLVGLRTPYPAPRNAVAAALVPGGSSSGSAVAVSRGIVSFALGTDTAGSGRVPAALNGIVGLKPTLGVISSSGVVPACRTLDTVSIFALTVADAYGVLRVAAVFDHGDAYARSTTYPPLPSPAPTFRIGVPDAATRRFFGDSIQAACFERALEDIVALGGEVVEIDFTPFFDVAALLYDGPWIAERYAVTEALLSGGADAIHPVTRQVIEAAKRFSAADAFRGQYRLQELRRATLPLIESVDALCVPTIPAFRTIAELEADPVGLNSQLGTYTNFVNLLDLCAIALPVAPRGDGWPGSVTLIAPAERDARIAALAASLQYCADAPLGATNWSLPVQAQTVAAPEPDEIALAVVGAHMSGLPLNSEFVRLGGRFLFTARTAPQYRLFRLPDGPPLRPGLLRAKTGAAILLEVWALPAARFGDFVRGVPAPLGIGTITLDNGDEVKGFLCEACATDVADDITCFGGWRAYLQSLPSSNPDAKESRHG
ncbi:MAG: allophanate hydrolase [Alphaproteobacteria bacterium]